MTSYSPEEAAFYQSSGSPYTTAHQDNFDKYTLFFERGLGLLLPHGRLGFITPHKFMTIQAGRALRRLLTLENSVEQIVHFGVEQVFGRAARNYTCIVVLDRRRSDTVRVEKANDLAAWRYGKPSHVMELPSVTLSEEPWQFAATDTRDLFERVRLACPKRLGALAEIFVGVQTSAGDIYIFPGVAETEEFVSLRWDGRDWPIERGILRPCLHDVQLFAYARPQPNAWMIFPYNVVTGRARPKATLIQLDDMVRRFPKGLAYLEARRGELESRHVSGGRVVERQFYQFGRSQSLVKFNSSKIILPALSLEPRYAYDDSNIVVTGGGNGPYYLLRARDSTIVSDKYLLAVLNHPLSEAFIRMNTSSFGGGYYAHGKQFIEDLPVPTAEQEQRSEIDHLVTEITAALTVAAASRTPREKTVAERSVTTIRNIIETRVSELFSLSAVDLALVHEVEVPG